jgi:hypothetical protein
MAVFYVVIAATRFEFKRVVADTKERAEKIAYDSPDDWVFGYQSDNYEHFVTMNKKEALEGGWLDEEVL